MPNDESRLDKMQAQLDQVLKRSQAEDRHTAKQNRMRALAKPVQEAKAVVDAAEKRLAKAYDEGSGEDIATATRELNAATADYTVKRREAELRYEQEDVPDDANLNAWKKRNAGWYGANDEMTKTAHAIDRSIRAAGVHAPGSEDYFAAIDQEMRKRYPDMPTTTGGGGTQTRVAKATADAWRKMGFDTSDPKVLEKLVKRQEEAREKGLVKK